MKKEELKALGLDDDTATKILAMRGRELEADKAKYLQLQNEKKVVENDFAQFKSDVEGKYVPKEKLDKLKQEKSTLNELVENLKASHESEINQIKYDTVLDKHLSEFKVKPQYTKFVKDVLDKDSLKFEEGKIEGIDEALKSAKETYADLFEADSSVPRFTQKQNDGSQGGGFATKESIMAIKDTKERLEAIQNNQELFI